MEITMNIQLPEGMQKKEWFNTTEFARGVKSTCHAVNQWIHRHPDFQKKYCQNISMNPDRVKWRVFWEGVNVYISLIGRTPSKDRNNFLATQKEKTAENFNNEYVPLRVLAKYTKLKENTILQWLTRHPEFAENKNYCKKIMNFWYFSKAGVTAFIAHKSASNDIMSDAKSAVAEIATNAIKQEQGQLSPAQALLQAVQLMVNIEQKLNNVEVRAEANEQKLVQLEQKIEQNSNELKKPLPLGSIHRQFLNDRVRMYAINQQIEFARVWRKINEYVGRGGVAFYEFADYQKALKFVKGLFEEAGMNWE